MEKLLPEIQASNKLLVLFRVFTFEIGEELFAAAHHLNKAIAGMMVFHIFCKMTGKTVNALCEDSDLNFCGPGIVLRLFVLGNNLFFLRLF